MSLYVLRYIKEKLQIIFLSFNYLGILQFVDFTLKEDNDMLNLQSISWQ